MKIKPCWSCGSIKKNCYEGCECLKCLYPSDYEEWKVSSPEEYNSWLESQIEEEEG